MKQSRMLTVSGVCLLALGAGAAEPFLEKSDLFEAGKEGYALYHIPGVAVTAKGTVLAWCEARKKGSDWDALDILLRRSSDNGKTFDAPKRIADVKGPINKNPFALRLKFVNTNDVTYNNPVLIPDRDGAVHGLFCVEYMRCFYMRSADDGATWSESVESTSVFETFRKAYDWKVLATGPDHGIQLKNGRLIVPVWLSTGTGGNAHRPSVTATIFSDDGGQTWPVSRVIEPGPSMYSDLAAAADGTVFCFYGRGLKKGFAGDRLTLARFNLEWLTADKETLK